MSKHSTIEVPTTQKYALPFHYLSTTYTNLLIKHLLGLFDTNDLTKLDLVIWICGPVWAPF